VIGAVIQARMGSTRLPGKVLMPLGGRSVLEQILHRLSFCRSDLVVVVATTTASRDDAVEEFCRARGVAVFRGSEENVLERYYRCALTYRFDQVVRLTGDNPFVDVEELDNLVALHLEQGADYSSSVAHLPTGAGAEIFTFEALERSMRQASAPHHFEHVNEYILENRDLFAIAELEVPVGKRSAARLTVDTEEDYRRACFIAAHGGAEPASCGEAVALAHRFASP